MGLETPQNGNPPEYRFHIVWMKSKCSQTGTSLSSGITITAPSMLEALAVFHKDISDVEPVYTLNLDADIPKVGTIKQS